MSKKVIPIGNANAFRDINKFQIPVKEFHLSRPRQGVPPPAKRLSCGRQCYGLPFRYGHDSCLIVACAPLTPLRAAVPCACSHRLGGSTTCLSRQPHKPKLLPFAATVAHGRFPQRKRGSLVPTEEASPSRPDNYLPLQRLTTPYRCRQTLPLQSVVRSPSRTSNTITGKLHQK